MNVMRNKWILRREIKWYSNRYLSNVFSTESGIIAAAHLSGPGNVKKYLRSHCDITPLTLFIEVRGNSNL